ncbi:MAG TPA: type II toxin-antitoxin system prevent-host-death family antitoxin [Candidatus Limnocylindria bacterium]|nr:type II toxin-antitoxin system prevent-host-death family antitoxin [Candidatus Limnocylindria bacterium]
MKPEPIGIRELREDLSKAIRRVRKGQVLEVTDHGRPVARIVPITPPVAGLSELIAAGKVRPPRASGPLPPPLELASRMSSERAIDLLRGE